MLASCLFSRLVCVRPAMAHTNGLSLFVGLGYVSTAVSIDTKRYKTVREIVVDK
jgi:hypothetical protein